jgi:hypothetical protein
MVWGTFINDEHEAVRNYIINRALRQYETGLALRMGTVVDEITGEAVESAHEEQVDLLGAATFEDASRTAKFLDRFEEEFFRRMREEMDRGAT